ncbi:MULTISPECIES: excinuclease ABC subunit UvrC [Pasteurellaceae]|uniref:UvrABC system protein C n=1 Tax=Pasteurella atlantica TaxID=2827233 RepID=A0AAW8CJ80_9PAST|nr:excinuclease ABC subunit UvrC [Pasteurella atlantica]MBR0572787.1 excinuclease ABC subunit UvrC [Pasteurella atlantica]MDP8038715.1 excinuclease ABC subunit UvrC [Pasteurella atlantica]MDP8040807.1 excinuclease ABC subunit UvrC [Pasteurella atlantica]MDP8043020.1 excinuclease ABC subunit UvrC [Pasteurella atlantica]MDP8045106.1 excinuclease ABC subunit UvrC [Pasteurella atlantica]
MATTFDHIAFLKNIPHTSGVYRMYDDKQTIIYVGKAKDLKKRLASYFRKNLTSRKTEALVSNIAHIEITLTHSETEALLLEHNYIKQHKPRYNVLLRDDKSYPYILLTHHPHPRITSFRGNKKVKGEYFGPYPNSTAVRETLTLLQKLFPIRQCQDSYYKNRSRPCLQYQIKRCLAPCVKGYCTDNEYDQQVHFVRLFLQGKDQQVITHLVQKMEQAAQNLNFEEAARYRDQIQAVRTVTEKQFVDNERLDDLDIIAIAYQHGIACVHILFVRQGKVLGNRSYFPKLPSNTDLTELCDTFVGQFYLQINQHRTIPNQIIINHKLTEVTALNEILTEQAGRKVTIIDGAVRGEKARYLRLAHTNATSALTQKLQQNSQIAARYQALQEVLNIPEIKRMECFDISHTMGSQTVASCVVFDQKGVLKSDYRRFNIEGITGGDDYAAMEKALLKRYNKPLTEDKIPDIIFIDGGKGQLNRALMTFEKLNVAWNKDHPLLIGVSKGVERKAGLETLIISKQQNKEIHLPPDSLALHLIQHIRDESHHHAITGHRKKRQKAFTESGLESIAGIGAKRRQVLLKYLGGMQGVKSATVEEIAKVPGISTALAEIIFDVLQNG